MNKIDDTTVYDEMIELEKKVIDIINLKLCSGNKQEYIKYLNSQKEKIKNGKLKINTYMTQLHTIYDNFNY
jgi:hypothetical protein